MTVTSTQLAPLDVHLDVRDYVAETRGQKLRERYDLRMTEDMKEALQSVAKRYSVDISDVIRAAIANAFRPVVIPSIDIPSVSAMLAEAAQSGELQEALDSGGLRLPMLGAAPGGPLREVVSDTNIHHFLSPATAEWLEAKSGDVLIVCDGNSMEGVGIPNGALLLLRPLPLGGRPQSGEVVLVQFKHKSGRYSSTIKTWVQSDPPLIRNGQGEDIKIPSDVEEVIPVAVARGIVSRFTRVPLLTK